MKVGIIRCMQTEDYCPGTADFVAIRNKSGAFAKLDGDAELIGFTNCGGCPGKRSSVHIEAGRMLTRRTRPTQPQPPQPQ